MGDTHNALMKKKELDLKNEEFKELARTRYERRKYTQEYMAVLMERASKYVISQADRGKPLTIGGFRRAMGISNSVWLDMRDGMKDGALYEFLEFHGLPSDYADGLDEMVYEVDGKAIPLITYSEFVDKIYTEQQELLEEACITKGNPVGAIFLLKSLHNFNDQSGVQITNQTMNVFDRAKLGTKEEIETARRLLG